MNINRHNYEEYFILYMDNELDAIGRRMVEAFAQQHPDLKEELELLEQYKFEPDTSIVFDSKAELMKVNGETPITLNNYEEWLLSSLDNELNNKQELALQQFMLIHPSLKKEYDLLKQSRLQPETVIFKDKASLYRKEETKRPAIWWRMAAAAILLIAAGITTVIMMNKKPSAGKGDEIVTTDPPIKTKGQTPVKVPQVNDQLVKEANNSSSDNIAVQQTPTPVVHTNTDNAVAVKQQHITPVQKKNNPEPLNAVVTKEEPLVAVKANNDLPTPLNNPNVIRNNQSNTALANHVQKDEIPEKALTNLNVTKSNPQTSEIINASFQDNNDVNDDQPDEKKNKSRGLFRKIARTFEKRTNIDPTDDNRLLVAGLAIKLK